MKQIEKLLIEEFKKNNLNFDTKPMVDYVDDSFTDVLKSVISVFKKLTIPVVMQSLPKRLSNAAYLNAREMRYKDFVKWWDEQV